MKTVIDVGWAIALGVLARVLYAWTVPPLEAPLGQNVVDNFALEKSSADQKARSGITSEESTDDMRLVIAQAIRGNLAPKVIGEAIAELAQLRPFIENEFAPEFVDAACRDPDYVVSLLDELNERKGPSWYQEWLSDISMELIEYSPKIRSKFLLSDALFRLVSNSVSRSQILARLPAEDAAALSESLPDLVAAFDGQPDSKLLCEWAYEHPVSVIDYLVTSEQQPTGDLWRRFLFAAVTTPEGAERYLESLGIGNTRAENGNNDRTKWLLPALRSAPKIDESIIDTLGLLPETDVRRKNGLGIAWERWSNEDPGAAHAYALSIQDSQSSPSPIEHVYQAMLSKGEMAPDEVAAEAGQYYTSVEASIALIGTGYLEAALNLLGKQSAVLEGPQETRILDALFESAPYLLVNEDPEGKFASLLMGRMAHYDPLTALSLLKDGDSVPLESAILNFPSSLHAKSALEKLPEGVRVAAEQALANRRSFP